MFVKNKQILCYNYQQSNSSLALFTINTLLTDTADWSMCGECGVQMVDNEEEEEGYHWDSGTRAVWILSNQPTPVLFPPINTNTHSGEINTTHQSLRHTPHPSDINMMELTPRTFLGRRWLAGGRRQVRRWRQGCYI